MKEKEKYRKVHLILDGRVQGVGYRFFTESKANKYNIYGWVKNLYDGRLEIMAYGKEPEIDFFLEEVKKGPWGAFVTSVEIVEDKEISPSEIPFKEFFIKPTGYPEY